MFRPHVVYWIIILTKKNWHSVHHFSGCHPETKYRHSLVLWATQIRTYKQNLRLVETKVRRKFETGC